MGNSVMLNGVEYAGEQIAYKDSTYELVSKVAYLIGVPLRIFQNEHEPPKIEIYNRFEQDKNARIIRNLCIIRTAIERNYRKINDIMRMEYRGLGNVYDVCCPVNISTEHIEFSRLRKTESVTLWTVHCRGKNKSLETGTPPALCVWHSVGGVFPCLSYEPVHLGAAFDSPHPRCSDGSPSNGVHRTAFHRAWSADDSSALQKCQSR